LRAQGDREAAVLRAQAERQAKMLRAEGEAQAITTVFSAIHAGEPDQALLAYQYMQMLPAIARGDANKVWVVPSELNDALKGLGSVVKSAASAIPGSAKGDFTPPDLIDVDTEIEKQNAAEEAALRRTVEKAIQEAHELERSRPGVLDTPEPPPISGTPNGQSDQESQPNLTQ
jgi:regulator of protease activity HflC (stomatin/prohibitin superfamily)